MQTHERRTLWAVGLFLLLAVALVFGRTVGYEFVNCDDDRYVYENPNIAQGLTVRGIRWVFTASHGDNWHPITGLSHMLDTQLYGLNPAGHHLTNLLLHAAATLLLFLILWRMTGFLWRSVFVAIVFAVHPLRVESVAWVSERKDVLSGLFFMLTLLAYIDYARRPFSSARYLTVAGLFALGLMSKPMLVTVPFVLLLLDYWPLGRMAAANGGDVFPVPRRVIFEKVPLLILAAASCAATFVAQSRMMVPTELIPISLRMANALISYIAYVEKFFFPVGLAVFYPHPESVAAAWRIAASLLILAGVSTTALIWRRRFPYMFVGWFWYLGMMIPVIGLVQVGWHSMADRYTYLPQIGLCVFITWGIAEGAALGNHRQRMLMVVSGLITLILMGLAWRQTSYWRNSETLWTRALKCTTDNYVAHYNMGAVMADRGRIDEAIAFYRDALRIRPGYVEAYNNLGGILTRIGKADEAILYYREAVAIQPRFAEAHYNLGMALAGRGQIDEAIDHYREAIASQPDFAEAWNNLGVLLADLGRTEEAVAHYRKALEIRPDDARAHNNLGLILAGRGAFDQAVVHYRRSLEIEPGSVEVENNLGAALAAAGQTDEAILRFQRALKIKPDHAKTRFNLGMALNRQGKTAEAIAQWREAIRLKPDHVGFLNQLAWVLATSPDRAVRNGAEAVGFAERAARLSGQAPAILDTLAAAYAEAGRFSEAVGTIRKAVTLALARGDKALAEAIRPRIGLYQGGTPYRETGSQAFRIR